MVKRIITIIVLVILLLGINNAVFGVALINKFDKSIRTTMQGTLDLKERGGRIVGTIQIVGTIAAVGMATVIGIKYALGSAEQKAEYKKTMLPYLIGTILIFAFSNITQLIYKWAIEI